MPDCVFQDILDAALTLAMDRLKDELCELEEAGLERTAELFDRAGATRELARLLEAHRSPRTFLPTPYHFLILYEVLQTFVDIRNDTCREAPFGDAEELWSAFGGVRIKDIDFDGLLDAYFPDLDFLFDPKVLNRLADAGRQMMGFKEQVFGIVNRLPPHPEELQLLECEPPDAPARPLFEAGKDYPRFSME
jgi:hypothetical protein